MRLEVDHLAGGGRGVAREGGRVWLVAGALPGELVEAEVERERAGITEARTVEVLTPSPWREPAPCPVAAACGGCDLGHVSRDAVVPVARAVVAGALRHAPRELAARVASANVVTSPWHYRLRATLHFDPASGRLGFFGEGSHTVVDIAPCRVVSELLLSRRPAIEAALVAGRLPAGELVWIENVEGTHAVAGWSGWGRPPRLDLPGLTGFHPLDHGGRVKPGGWGATSVAMRIPLAGPDQAASLEPWTGPRTPDPEPQPDQAHVSALTLTVPIGAFFQGNRHLVSALLARVAGLVTGAERVVDLYGGVGFLAAAARHAGATEVTLVEASRVAAAAARENLPGVRVVPATAEAFLRRTRGAAPDVAIVDPPRRGLSNEAREGLLRLKPARIVMLACDPASFGRDAGALLAGGWELELVELWDLFAGSHHVETLASFRRPAA